MGVRGDAIVQFDWSVGKIMETLDKLGIADNTIVLLTSDNGPVVDDGYQDQAEELLNGHKPAGPWRGNKYSAFEGGTAIPVIVRWPMSVNLIRPQMFSCHRLTSWHPLVILLVQPSLKAVLQTARTILEICSATTMSIVHG